MVPVDVYTTHIYSWSAAEAAAAPVPLPVVGRGSCVPRVRVAVLPPLGKLLCAPSPVLRLTPTAAVAYSVCNHARTPLLVLVV